jgi:hypothetical protein
MARSLFRVGTAAASEKRHPAFCAGRKNWLFANAPRGACASASLYSLVETAKANGLEPYHYLKYLFTHLPMACTPDALGQLLPTCVKPEYL